MTIEQRPHWSGGRNYSQAMSGEYEPCAGYTFKRTLMQSVANWRHSNWSGICITAETRIEDNRRKFRCVIDGAERIDVVSGRCKSIADALRQSDDALSKNDFVKASLLAMFQNERTRIHVARDGVPFATLFCSDFSSLPDGYYTADKYDEIKVWGSGYSASVGPSR
jgi:hypothetical protein